MLKIEHFSKSYGSKKAVDDLSLHIKAGEIYGFIGHNGAGKTTTLKAACGILPIDEGEIYVDGISVRSALLECKRRIAYLPDEPYLYEFMTGMQYLDFIADVFGIDAKTRSARIEAEAVRFGLGGALGQHISTYSHGMKQKLAVIAALLHEPALMLMDEPFVGLDPKAAYLLKTAMREFCARGGAIFFSTHVLEAAEKLCDKVAIIRAGRLVRAGTLSEVRGGASLEDAFLETEGGDGDV